MAQAETRGAARDPQIEHLARETRKMDHNDADREPMCRKLQQLRKEMRQKRCEEHMSAMTEKPERCIGDCKLFRSGRDTHET